RTKLEDTAKARAAERAARTGRPRDAKGVQLTPLARTIEGDAVVYQHVLCDVDRARGIAEITVQGPRDLLPAGGGVRDIHALGAEFWPLALARELDDLILHLRTNEEEIGVWVLKTEGDASIVDAYDKLLAAHASDWLVREIRLYLKRVFKRPD